MRPPSLAVLHLRYEEAAQEYLRSLPLEHFMEAVPQATQRKITLESLDLVHARRPEVQVFNELLVQYPIKDQEKPGQVVPDNMVVVHDNPIKADGCFNTPLQPVGPLWVLEYVSKSNSRKDYDDNMQKYEKELKVPYYLLFVPDLGELTLYRRRRAKYVSVKPNSSQRYLIDELEIEVGLLDDWARFWFQGELLPLPGDMLRENDSLREELQSTEKELESTQEELARLKAELEQYRREKP